MIVYYDKYGNVSSPEPLEKLFLFLDKVPFSLSKNASLFEYLGKDLYRDRVPTCKRIWAVKEEKDPRTGTVEKFLVAYSDDEDEIVRKLSYSLYHNHKQSSRRPLPKVGSVVRTPDGVGTIVSMDNTKTIIQLHSKDLSNLQRIKTYPTEKALTFTAEKKPETLLAPGVLSKSMDVSIDGEEQRANVHIEFTDPQLAQDFFSKIPNIIFQQTDFIGQPYVGQVPEHFLPAEEEKEKEEGEKGKKPEENVQEQIPTVSPDSSYPIILPMPPIDNKNAPLPPIRTSSVKERIDRLAKTRLLQGKSTIVKSAKGTDYIGLLNDNGKVYFINEFGNPVYMSFLPKVGSAFIRPDTGKPAKALSIVSVSESLAPKEDQSEPSYYILTNSEGLYEILVGDTLYVKFATKKAAEEWALERGYSSLEEFEKYIGEPIDSIIGKWLSVKKYISVVNDPSIVKLLGQILYKSDTFGKDLQEQIRKSIEKVIKQKEPLLSSKFANTKLANVSTYATGSAIERLYAILSNVLLHPSLNRVGIVKGVAAIATPQMVNEVKRLSTAVGVSDIGSKFIQFIRSINEALRKPVPKNGPFDLNLSLEGRQLYQSLVNDVRNLAATFFKKSTKVAVSPPGWKDAIEKMKKEHFEEKTGISPFAIAWSMYNKGKVPGKRKKKKKRAFKELFAASVARNLMRKVGQNDNIPPMSWNVNEPLNQQNVSQPFSPQNVLDQNQMLPALQSEPNANSEVVYDSAKDRMVFQTTVDPLSKSVIIRFFSPEEEEFKGFIDKLVSTKEPQKEVSSPELVQGNQGMLEYQKQFPVSEDQKLQSPNIEF